MPPVTIYKKTVCYLLKIIISHKGSKDNTLGDILPYFFNGKPYLIHTIPFANGDTSVVFTFKVVCDTERRTYLILTAVSFANGAAVVKVTVEIMAEVLVDVKSLIGQLPGKRKYSAPPKRQISM